MFNSQKINTDPKPYACKPCGLRVVDAEFCDHGGTLHARRAEYDNNPNPALEYARMAYEHNSHSHTLPEAAQVVIGTLNYMEGRGLSEWKAGGVVRHFTPEHIDHARRVLTRLVNLHTNTQGE